MGKRLSKIYTRTGDAGETGLGNGDRVGKSHPRIEAMGDADELNSALGMLIEEIRAQNDDRLAPIAEFLRWCQHRVFDLGGEISIPGYAIVTDNQVERIESALDELNADLAPLENFIVPGGSRIVAACHWVRSLCRRAERRIVALGEVEEINAAGGKFLNRLSDYLFVAARHMGKVTGVPEVLWRQDDSDPT